MFAFVNNPLMLAWLAAAAAPLIIHLLSRRRHREIQWAAMQYLLAAMRKNSRRIQVEQWLLLAIRTLAVALLVFAVAEPFVESAGALRGGNAHTLKVLVLDGSLSMHYRSTDKTRFERAQALAEQIVDESPEGDGFALVLMQQQPRTIIGPASFDQSLVRQEIAALSVSHGQANLPATFSLLEQLIRQAQAEQPRLRNVQVYFLTDLARRSWLPEGSSTAAAEQLRQRGAQLGQAASLSVIDLGQANSDNLAITNLELLEPYATAGRELHFELTLHNFGRQTQSGQQVELLVDGRRVAQQQLTLEPDTSASLVMTHRFESLGESSSGASPAGTSPAREQLVEARLSGDLLDADNHRYLSLLVKPRVRVLCVNGRPSGEYFGNATDHLAQALAAGSDNPAHMAIATEVVTESALVELDLSAYDCIFLANVGQFTTAEANVLANYLQRGGSLVFFLGDQVQIDNYNRRLAEPADPTRRVLPAVLLSVAEEPQLLDPLDYHHRLLEPFRGQQRGGLLTTPINQYVRLKLPEGSAANVAVALQNGEPLIVEEAIGRGRSTLVATSADTSWSPMPVLGSYVPIIRELLAHSLRKQSERRTFLLGEPLGGLIDAGGEATTLTLQPPTGEPLSVRLQAEGNHAYWSLDAARLSGPYRLKLPEPNGGEHLYVANINPADSDLSRLDPAQLRVQVFGGAEVTHRTDWQEDQPDAPQTIVNRDALHRKLLLAVLGLLVSESVLASWLGRRGT